MMYEEVVSDFAKRTKANLEALEGLKAEGKQVFELTQLVNSTLGLLVFPQQEYVDSIPCTSLSELQVLNVASTHIGWKHSGFTVGRYMESMLGTLASTKTARRPSPPSTLRRILMALPSCRTRKHSDGSPSGRTPSPPSSSSPLGNIANPSLSSG